MLGVAAGPGPGEARGPSGTRHDLSCPQPLPSVFASRGACTVVPRACLPLINFSSTQMPSSLRSYGQILGMQCSCCQHPVFVQSVHLCVTHNSLMHQDHPSRGWVLSQLSHLTSS